MPNPKASSDSSAKEPRARPGGRSAKVRSAVIAATLSELERVGYDALTLPRVAEVAGVSNTTLYRRWSSKAQLVAEVAVEFNAASVPPPPASTAREELLAVGLGAVRMLSDPTMNGLARGLVASPAQEVEEIREKLWGARAAIYQEIADRAAGRGEIIENVDGWSLVEMISAPIWMRLVVTGRSVDRAWVEGLVDRALKAFAP